jgi:tetratricopeptide (TPR) repeat protein
MVPIIAFYLLIAVYGAREFFKMVGEYFGEKKVSNALTIIFFVITAIFSTRAYAECKTDYAEQCHKIAVRNLAASKWINENTPPDAVIATHDIGAIAYYTRRRILDVAGLVSPQFTDHLFDADFNKFMLSEMKKANVGYIAFIREWYQVVNTNPLFSGGENGEEILQVHKFDPEKTHILSREVNGSVMYAMQLFGAKQVPQAEQLIMKLIAADPLSSFTYFLLANAQSSRGDSPGAEKSLRKALEIFPEFREANFMLADLYSKQKRTAEARTLLNGFLGAYPNDSDAQKLLKTVTDSTAQK